jgi:hypothetical protein
MMVASVIDFQIKEIEMEFLRANQLSEFSHSLGSERTSARPASSTEPPDN